MFECVKGGSEAGKRAWVTARRNTTVKFVRLTEQWAQDGLAAYSLQHRESFMDAAGRVIWNTRQRIEFVIMQRLRVAALSSS